MNRGAREAIVPRSQRVGQDLATTQQQIHFLDLTLLHT